jgi:hypothetical protein
MTASPARRSRGTRHARSAGRTDGVSSQPPLAESNRPNIAPALQTLAVPIASIDLHPRNPRIGDVEAVAASLRRFGQQKPIVVQASTMFCVAGNHLLRAARSLGWSEIAANVEDLDDATAIAYMLADNRTSDLSSYDDGLLAAILAEQTAADNLAATGYDPAVVAALLRAAGLDDRDPDDVPDLPFEADVYVKPGELWVLGSHRLLCGDAINAADVARLLDGAAPTLLATDPPYGVRLDQTWRDGAGYNALGRAAAPYMRIAGPPEEADTARAARGGHRRRPGFRNTTLSGDTRADWSAAFALVPSLLVGYVWYASAHTLEVLEGLLAIGFELTQQVIWDKGRFAMSRQWYHWAHEPCFVVRKPGAKVPFYGERKLGHDLASAFTQDDHGGLDRGTAGPSHPEARGAIRDPHRQPPAGGRGGLRPVLWLGDHHRRGRTPGPPLLRHGDRSQVRPSRDRALADVQRQDAAACGLKWHPARLAVAAPSANRPHSASGSRHSCWLACLPAPSIAP